MNINKFISVLPEGTCIIIVGISGSGKTTVAETLASRIGDGSLLGSDIIREVEMQQKVYQEQFSRVVFQTLHQRLDKRMEAGETTVVDSTSVSYGQRLGFVEVAERHNRPIVLVWCNLDPEEAWERNARRGAEGGRLVPYEAIQIQMQHLEESKMSFASEKEKHNYLEIYTVDDDLIFEVADLQEQKSY